MLALNESRVIFTDNPHSYHLDGKELCGVTTMLSKYIFEKKYFGISEEVLAKAADRGSRVHEQCRAFDMLGVIASKEVEEYVAIRKRIGLTTVANEYTVSDNESVASKIDLVAHVNGDAENEVVLCDFKTTSHMDVEYLSWQLSVYKYLFELNNPNIKVKGLIGIWLPLEKYGKPRAEWIAEKPMEVVRDLIRANATDGEFTLPPTADLPPVVQVLQQRCYDVIMRIKEAEMLKEELTSRLYEAMEKYDLKSWSTDDFTITRVLPSKQERFDSKKFKAENQALYDKYKTTTDVKGSVKITIKKKKEN